MGGKLETWALWVLACVFAGVAGIGMCAPTVLFDPTGIALDTGAGAAEIRAAYGGLFGAVAYVFLDGAREPTRRRQALFVAVLVLGGFVLGRLVSWCVDGTPSAPVAIVNLAAESLGFVVVLFLWRVHQPSEDGSRRLPE